MTILLIILLILAVVWFYYRQKRLSFDGSGSASSDTALSSLESKKAANQALITFLRDHLNSASLTELKSKLGEKTLDEILEEHEDYETEVDTLTRAKNSLEQDLTAQAEAFQARIREKDREVKKLKEDLTNEQKRQQKQTESLTSEKQQHKGSLERIKLLTEQITKLEKTIKQAQQEHNEQLRSINLLFDDNAKSYESIDFNGLYSLLKSVTQEKMPGEFPEEAPKEGSPELEKFISWAENHEELAKVDWAYYRTQPDWEKSFRQWNSLRTDRLSLLAEWKEQND